MMVDSGYLKGTRYNPENTNRSEGGHFQAKTSNADIHVHYANPDV